MSILSWFSRPRAATPVALPAPPPPVVEPPPAAAPRVEPAPPIAPAAPQPRPANRLQRGGHVVALAVAVIGGFEGLRQTAYPDPASRGDPWTICYGHARHVSPGDHASLAECKRLLLADLDVEASGIEKCITAPMSDTRYVAVLSLAHNIGLKALCKSSVVADLNAKRDAQACNDFLKYDRAAGVVFSGLVTRRETERKLCLE